MKVELFGGPMDGTETEIEDGRIEQLYYAASVITAAAYPPLNFGELIKPPVIPTYQLVYRRTRASRRDRRIFRYEGIRA
jgi:hypothetical protein